MTREKMKSIFTVHTNGKDEWIKVPKRTYDKMIDMFCDAHEAKLTKACEILEGANLAEIERHFAECKAKDERIAELGTMIEKMKCCEYYPPSKCGKSAQYGCLGDGYNDWRLKMYEQVYSNHGLKDNKRLGLNPIQLN